MTDLKPDRRQVMTGAVCAVVAAGGGMSVLGATHALSPEFRIMRETFFARHEARRIARNAYKTAHAQRLANPERLTRASAARWYRSAPVVLAAHDADWAWRDAAQDIYMARPCNEADRELQMVVIGMCELEWDRLGIVRKFFAPSTLNRPTSPLPSV